MPAKKSEDQKSGLELQIDPNLRYEQAVKELEKLISDMESGKFSLEETLLAYQRGAALLKHCQAMLAQVEQQVRVFEA
ncbi:MULTISPECIES: exodeoxyribonuclease VII small subunit [unclassified Polynucleobacter]|jgi:exodeoxyribonuclease VII small subunit|uniref:exodeoxyribonuclease VII small subunit n=1 Tax=unclassified Polynucleobacter TaxID=2640945 RepID=UPI001BFD1009|nr:MULTISPECIES: exodeoxyribonuclease VII small subunit [unclassified Polynucleobacter]MBU3559712.1 exodeoxyribonuclease VII small subunit [Polynucleobacter sp. Nonnen-W13]QWE14253.1 exodeoxyribonuclease VII small subunit [Polynucleobacter sp. AP-Sving-400A-A2]QWE30413.1 exodeoxyribonuclease VII small subunit [Polynucleobacter sp. Adler-ghost]